MNDCVFMIGLYPKGYKIPAANDPKKKIPVGGWQICALNIKNNHQYPCPYTTYGAIVQCADYLSRGLNKPINREANGIKLSTNSRFIECEDVDLAQKVFDVWQAYRRY